MISNSEDCNSSIISEDGALTIIKQTVGFSIPRLILGIRRLERKTGGTLFLGLRRYRRMLGRMRMKNLQIQIQRLEVRQRTGKV